MANYNTFNLVDTKTRKTLVTTSSARKCKKELQVGRRIDVWNGNTLIEVIYAKNIDDMNKYVRLEKEHIARKQQIATERNRRRRERAMQDERKNCLRKEKPNVK